VKKGGNTRKLDNFLQKKLFPTTKVKRVWGEKNTSYLVGEQWNRGKKSLHRLRKREQHEKRNVRKREISRRKMNHDMGALRTDELWHKRKVPSTTSKERGGGKKRGFSTSCKEGS